MTFVSLNLGSIILFIPRGLANELETPDGWISMLINGVVMLILITLYTRLQKHFPEENLLQWMRNGWMGKWVTKGFSILFIIHNLFIIALVARVLGITVNSFLLDETPVEIIVSVFLLTVTYCVSKGVQGVIHINIMLIPIILVVLFGVFLFAGIHFEPSEITPVLSEGIIPILNRSISTSHPFVGGLYFFSYLWLI
ncbi:hypothetical protein BTR23_09445 [Alkalihalophilus pseudofirmus]|nr:hypothetical protein BTR23_09445 [Alkalihalophilus pseudofirmus]